MIAPQHNMVIVADLNQLNEIISSAIAESFKAQVNAKIPVEDNSLEQLLTYQETCDMLKTNRSTLHRWIKRGFITPRYLGSTTKPYFRKSDILEALKAKEKPELPV
mgnify:CR=1 FL=1